MGIIYYHRTSGLFRKTRWHRATVAANHKIQFSSKIKKDDYDQEMNRFMFLKRLSINTSVTALRILLPMIGMAYLAIESREIFELRQLTSFTMFVFLFMMANFQMGVSRALLGTTKRKSGFRAFQSVGLMFVGTLFAAIDAALDTFFDQLNLLQNTPIIIFLFILGWLCNSAAVVFGLISMDRFIPLLNEIIQAPIKKLDPDKKAKN